MKSRVLLKVTFISFLFSLALECQRSPIPGSSNTVNSNIPKTPASQANSETKVTGPQRIKFESAEKFEISGTFCEAMKADSPAVLLPHQWGSNRKSDAVFARRLQAKRIGVLAIDGRGFGESVKMADGKTLSPNRTDQTVTSMKRTLTTLFSFWRNGKILMPPESESSARFPAAVWR